MHNIGIESDINLLLNTIDREAFNNLDKKILISSKKSKKDYKFKKNFFVESNYAHALIAQKNLFQANVRDYGKDITIDYCSDKNCLNLSRRILGTVIPFSLHQMGRLVLHSSAIEKDGKAILFLGNSGSGKSSLVASLQSYNFITEDIASIEEHDGSCKVIPSFPYIKLTKRIAESYSVIDKEKIYLKNDRLKRSFYKVNNFVSKPVEINKCIFLQWGDSSKIHELNSTEILEMLLKSYIGAFPIDSCHKSSSVFMSFFEKLSKQANFFKFTRKIDDSKDINKEIKEIL